MLRKAPAAIMTICCSISTTRTHICIRYYIDLSYFLRQLIENFLVGCVIKDLMMQAGFTKAEADVYICLLENGPLKASVIANKTGLYRPYVYDNLDNLTEKIQRIDELIPQLENMMMKSNSDVVVEVYKGKNAIRKAFLDILKILKENPKIVHLGMGIEEEAFLGAEPVFSRWFIKQLEKNHIRERMISYESEKICAGGKPTEPRFIPDKSFTPTQILIDGEDFLAFVGYHALAYV